MIILSIACQGSPIDGTVKSVELEKFSGKWYALSSIPGDEDIDWREMMHTYTVNNEDNIDILTSYRKIKESQHQSIQSKASAVKGTNNAQWKVLSSWPFQEDFWVIELADDYSYAIIGHPKKKQLIIQSRKPFLETKLFQDIIRRCKDKGYNTDRLVSQDHEAK